ncbi:DEAD/DEAH box helicase [Chloracidobacterium sp. MS 40/45]|uniref:helicase-related protein n=1 Tax=Chloracidobacterium aggregatum TaxID=2851959 RepID=UPI001B8CDCF4|nr:helicase-related protein [Chloracidobacterium aggregatum]QUW01736.1 DEAD/DEAH box helicase [Chloracidobacterium sp. MS 40/45]
MHPGSIVRCRNREWVVMPADTDEVIVLRPLTGTPDDVVHIHRKLMNLVGGALPFERITPASFPLPTAGDVSDATSAHLLWQAARLTLREGATPFRSLGRISIRPRTYQFVPLLMALRLDPVRLFIADDVGVGKTIEALLIARELLDRGEIRRFCVLCPPYLCEQWAKELAEKFNLEPAIIRSGTVGQLDRQTPAGRSLYEHFPVQVASIDFVKTERNRSQFLQFCPDLVIADEVHGAAAAPGTNQQERHALISAIARKADRHLIMLTATPHSGIEDAFRSLLGLLRPEFGTWNLQTLNEPQRTELARHFVQRTRRDIGQTWQETACFPTRESTDETYALSDRHRELFERTYAFCSEIVRTGAHLEKRQRRVRYWGALALLRCVMSSPAAALTALTNRAGVPLEEEAEAEAFGRLVFESAEDRTDDESPAPAVEAANTTLPEPDRRRLRELARLAEQLHGTGDDTKLARVIEIVRRLLKEGFHPILWCRYVATAGYLADHMRQALETAAQVVCVTGRMGDDERQAKIADIEAGRPRVLVATDCLSEGVNLQEMFTAVIHYDLPWNPNRLEQREGRVDRYGQKAGRVRVIRFFGQDNPIDGVVLEVLLDKAREIHRTLGTHVPVPEASESVTQAVLEALFLREGRRALTRQLALNLRVPEVDEFHHRWQQYADHEQMNRTRFAQRALKPEEVQREVEATDAVLGDPTAVRHFFLAAAQRLGLAVAQEKQPGVFRVSVSRQATATLPEPIRLALPSPKGERWRISFDSPTPEGAEYIGRNHRFVATLARYLFEAALNQPGNAMVSRCGAIRTRAVTELTTILLLRARYMVEQPPARPLLSEEIVTLAGVGLGDSHARWLDTGDALRLLAEAQPDANLSLAEKRELVTHILAGLGAWQAEPAERWGAAHPLQRAIREHIARRAAELTAAHKRIRQAVALRVRGLEVKPQFPPDLLGILVLQPMVSR